MKLAYIISAYRRPDQLVRLVDRLADGTTELLVHVDRRTDDATYRAMVDGTRRIGRVRFLKRHTCYWGGFGHVAATLEGIRDLVERRVPFDYAMLLTGQDYPIKRGEQIDGYLEARRGQLFLEHFPLPHPEWEGEGMDRITAWHWRVRGRYLRLAPGPRFPIKRRIPHGMRPFGGSSYWCLTRDALEYIDRWTRQHPRFVDFFKLVEVPDELFFQTIVMNSELSDRVVNDDLRYVEWGDPASASPSVLRAADFPKLGDSPKLFARKFDSAVDARVMELIDRHLLGVSRGAEPAVVE